MFSKRPKKQTPPRERRGFGIKTNAFPNGKAFEDEAPGGDLLLHGQCHTTIGAAAFHFRVRDGIGWDHSAIAARERVKAALNSARFKL